MILTYRPEGADEQRWDLTQTRATFAEAKAAEKAGGFQWVNLEQELAEGNLGALQAALWVFRKRAEPTLTFADLDDLPLGSVDVDFGVDERAFMRAQIAGNESLSDEAKAAALRMLGYGDEDPEAEAAAEDGPDPKAPQTDAQEPLPEAPAT